MDENTSKQIGQLEKVIARLDAKKAKVESSIKEEEYTKDRPIVRAYILPTRLAVIENELKDKKEQLAKLLNQ